MAATGGVVYLVGAGPGDPGLLTMRGRELLGEADVLIYDHLVHPRLVALAPPDALRIFAGKRAGHCVMPQEQVNALMVQHAQAGRRVIRLKGGDPFVFGRGAEEAEHLKRAGVPFVVVPGVTAGVGATAYAGLPITHRHSASAVAFVTGHDDPERQPARLDWPALARFPGTLVIYMGVSRVRSLCHILMREGKDPTTRAAMVQSGTLVSQRTVVATLADLPDRVIEAGLGPPALLIVGEIVARRPALSWYEQLPLFGQRIVVTRPLDASDRAAAMLESLGAEVLPAPTVVIRPLTDYSRVDSAIERLADFDWLVFTSANGVRHFLGRLEVRRDLRALGHLKLAAIGPATAEALAAFHLRADIVPETFRSEGLLEALSGPTAGRRVLLARADRGRALLREELERLAQVEQIAVYSHADAESLPAEVIARISAGTVDWITLTSSAITESLYQLLPPDARHQVGQTIKLASISPVTSATAAKLGWAVTVEASVHTWDGLVQALMQTAARPQ
jgi:uroporphyrinogen III methyltransferase/synthase